MSNETLVNGLKSRLAAEKAQGDDSVPLAPICAESDRQCAAAWAKVVEVLDEVAPDWLAPALNGDDCAVKAIRDLAGRALPAVGQYDPRSPVASHRPTCDTCGETLVGDGFSTAIHCPNADADYREPDSETLHCEPVETTGPSVAQLVADGALSEFTPIVERPDYDLPAMQYAERPPLTLDEIVAAVRTNELVTGRDMRYAIVAFDVLMSELRVDRNVEQLAVFFKAAESVPRDYIGEANDPENTEAVEWYRAMRGVSGK